MRLLAYARSVAAFIYDGAWEHVRGALEPSTFTNPDLMLFSGGLRDLAAAMMQCRRGHVEEAIVALNAAVGALTDYDPWSVLHTALGLLAYCLAMRGDIAGSQERLEQLAALNRRSNKFYYLKGRPTLRPPNSCAASPSWAGRLRQPAAGMLRPETPWHRADSVVAHGAGG